MRCENCRKPFTDDESVYRLRAVPQTYGAPFPRHVCAACAGAWYYSPEELWYKPRACRGCGRPVIYSRRDWRERQPKHPACCRQCQYTAFNRAKRKPLAAALCATCGELFQPSRSDAHYCSSACRQAAYRARQA